MRALVDTNVILDVLLNREAFLPASGDVWLANEQGLFEGFVSAMTPVNVYYVARSYRKDKRQPGILPLQSWMLSRFAHCA